MLHLKKCLFLVFVFVASTLIPAKAQESKPGMAFLKSLVLPGWGHFSLGEAHYNRGYVHLGTDLALMLSYWGIDTRTQHLQQNIYAHVELNANTSIRNRGRGYVLAVGQFENLAAYNEYQERNRNWNAFISDTPENRWQWSSLQNQANYIKMNNEIDANKQQLPFILTAMVANRLVSGISAFIRAREMSTSQTSISFQPVQENGIGTVSGAALHVRIGF